MLKQAEPPQSLPAFGMGVAVGFGAGITVRIICPGVLGLVEAVLSKLGFEIGDILLALWRPEQQMRPVLQLADRPSVERKKPRRKTKPTAQRRIKVQPARKTSRKATTDFASSSPRLRRIDAIEVGSN